jgi:signal transduction histidine kinase
VTEHLPEILGAGALLVAVVAILAAVRAVRTARGREEFATQSANRARRMKNEFVSMVSHELRTPLTSIAGFTDTLLESWKNLPTDEIDEFLTIINKQAVHLSELVEDVLVIPRLEAGRLRLDLGLFDVSEVAHDVTNAILPPGTAREAAVAIPGGVSVFADRRRVQQILRNLVENAHKYGGDQVLVEGSPYGEFYLIVVSDNGPGIPEQDVDRVFTHFEQLSKGDARSDKGIGLGLHRQSFLFHDEDFTPGDCRRGGRGRAGCPIRQDRRGHHPLNGYTLVIWSQQTVTIGPCNPSLHPTTPCSRLKPTPPNLPCLIR